MLGGVRRAGLRLQIVLAVVGLMALAFVPLFFAVASLTRVALHGLREDSARALGRAVAAHAAEIDTRDSSALQNALASHTGSGGVDAVCVYDERGGPVACAGDEREIAEMHAPDAPFGERTEDVHGALGTAVEVTVPRPSLKDKTGAGGVVVARLRTGEETDRAAPLVRLVAVYMTVFGLAFAFIVSVALTRLIVRPVEALARATDRVATGARKLEVPPAGARELVDLSSSVNTMTTRLFADEEKLRRKVEELTETTHRLTEAQAHLVRSERLASVGRLAAGMAHEIGNPITAIMGMQDLLLAGDVPPAEQGEYVARMRKETERIHKILRDLLDFARPESPSASESGPVGGPVSLSEAVADVLSLLKPQRVFRDVEVTVDVAPGVAVRLAKDRLEQVLLNLALNACDAMADKKAKKLSIRASPDGDRVRVTIEDTGPGVAEEVRERLFLPFVTTKEVGLGTGLGLAVCRGIVEGAGGRIDLDTSYRDGARFVITLRT